MKLDEFSGLESFAEAHQPSASLFVAALAQATKVKLDEFIELEIVNTAWAFA